MIAVWWYSIHTQQVSFGLGLPKPERQETFSFPSPQGPLLVLPFLELFLGGWGGEGKQVSTSQTKLFLFLLLGLLSIEAFSSAFRDKDLPTLFPIFTLIGTLQRKKKYLIFPGFSFVWGRSRNCIPFRVIQSLQQQRKPFNKGRGKTK